MRTLIMAAMLLAIVGCDPGGDEHFICENGKLKEFSCNNCGPYWNNQAALVCADSGKSQQQ